MSRKPNCHDNAAMKSFWSRFKRECADGIHPTRRDGAAAAFENKVRRVHKKDFTPAFRSLLQSRFELDLIEVELKL